MRHDFRTPSLLLFLILLAGTVFLTACDLPVVGIAEVQAEIEDYENFERQGLKVTSFEETFRVTDQEEGEDEIRVKLQAENGFLRYTASYTVSYERENDTWVLDDIEIRKSTLEPIQEPGKKLLKKDLLRALKEDLGDYCPSDLTVNAQKVQNSTNDPENGDFSRVISVEFTGESPSCSIKGRYLLQYKLDIQQGWQCTGAQDDGSSCSVDAPDEKQLAKLLSTTVPTVDGGLLPLPSDARLTSVEASDSIEQPNCYLCVYSRTISEFPNLSIEQDYRYWVYFDLPTGWQIYDADCTSPTILDATGLTGTWSYRNGNEHITMVVSQVRDGMISVNYGNGPMTFDWTCDTLRSGFLQYSTETEFILFQDYSDFSAQPYPLLYVASSTAGGENGFKIAGRLLQKTSDSTYGEGEYSLGYVDPSDEFNGMLVEGADFYNGCEFENWTGIGYTWWQACIAIHPDEMDFQERDLMGTDAYPWTWTLHVRPAKASADADPGNDAWTSVVCQLDTVGFLGDDTVIYRPQPGTGFDGLFRVDKEYEMVVTITDGFRTFKTNALYFYWTDTYETSYRYWKAGRDVYGVTANCFVPTIAPHDGLTPTPRGIEY